MKPDHAVDWAWVELHPGLLDGVRDRMRGQRSLSSMVLRIELGALKEKRLLIASGFAIEELRAAIEAFLVTHKVERLVLVGRASAAQDESALDTIWTDRAMPVGELPSADFRTGPQQVPSPDVDRVPILATDWADEARCCLIELGCEGGLIAQQAGGMQEGELLKPPRREKQASWARRAGRWAGALWAGPGEAKRKVKRQRQQWAHQIALADVVEELVSADVR